MHTCNIPRSCVWCDSCVCVTRPFYMCDMTYPCESQDLLIRMPWLLLMTNMPPSTWVSMFIHVCDMTHLYEDCIPQLGQRWNALWQESVQNVCTCEKERVCISVFVCVCRCICEWKRGRDSEREKKCAVCAYVCVCVCVDVCIHACVCVLVCVCLWLCMPVWRANEHRWTQEANTGRQHKVAETHRIPYLCRSFSAKVT